MCLVSTMSRVGLNRGLFRSHQQPKIGNLSTFDDCLTSSPIPQIPLSIRDYILLILMCNLICRGHSEYARSLNSEVPESSATARNVPPSLPCSFAPLLVITHASVGHFGSLFKDKFDKRIHFIGCHHHLV